MKDSEGDSRKAAGISDAVEFETTSGSKNSKHGLHEARISVGPPKGKTGMDDVIIDGDSKTNAESQTEWRNSSVCQNDGKALPALETVKETRLRSMSIDKRKVLDRTQIESPCLKALGLTSLATACTITSQALQSGRENRRKLSWGSYILTWTALVIEVPIQVTKYVCVVSSYELYICFLLFDLWDICTDVVLTYQFQGAKMEVIVWLYFALVLGFMNFLYRGLTVSRGRAYVTKQNWMRVYGSDPGNADSSDRLGDMVRARFFDGLFLVSSTLCQDALVMIAGILRGWFITGTAELISYITTAIFVFWGLAQTGYTIFIIFYAVCRSPDRGKIYVRLVFEALPMIVAFAITLALWSHFLTLFFRASTIEGAIRSLVILAAAITTLCSLISLLVFQTVFSLQSDSENSFIYGPFQKSPEHGSLQKMEESAVFKLYDIVEETSVSS